MTRTVQNARPGAASRATARSRALFTLTFTLITAVAAAQPNDAVMEWNDVARTLTLTAVPALAPVQQTRAMAIVQVAVHDAVNGITGRYSTYQEVETAPAGASPEAAAIAAAHHALRDLFGAPNLDAQFLASLAAHSISVADPGIEFGRSVAVELLARRADDGAAEASFPYVPPGAGTPGVWVPLGTQRALLPGWGNVTPWVLRSGSQFRPDPPPALDTEAYARDYNEVLEVGALTGSTRTTEQTQIALFWRASPTAIWNAILRQAVAFHAQDLSASARAFALFYLAGADASVASWEAKYYYNFWRPLPAILNGDIDGNDATEPYPTWAPLLGTPAHPEYPSAHTTNSGAMAAILRSLFGDAPGFVIEATSSENPGFTRYWDTFSEGVEEVIDARVYSGFHFRSADEAGARLGRQVARFVLTHALRPARGNRK